MNPNQSTAAGEPVREHLRDVSLETIDHVKALNLTLFLDKKAKLSEKESEDQVLALIWLLHVKNNEDAIAASVAAGLAWQHIRDFRREPCALWALPEVVPAVQKVKEILGRNHFLDAVASAADGEESGE